ncbi:MAG: DUF1801 domain-containing protein [Herbiconiux sp.]|nr:DUF1801 domain-containing protein [Herbiconiux sp.]
MKEQTVDGFVVGLDEPRRAEVLRLREIVLAADAGIHEGVKWNAPSFAVDDWFATMNLRPGAPLRLVLHTGAKAVPGHPKPDVLDPDGLLRWLGHDRAIVSFADRADLEAKAPALTRILQQWVPQLPKTPTNEP